MAIEHDKQIVGALETAGTVIDAVGVVGGLDSRISGGFRGAGILIRAIAAVVKTHGEEATRVMIHDLAQRPPKRANLVDAEAAVDAALAARDDAAEDTPEDA